jgi:hypothetical protein
VRVSVMPALLRTEEKMRSPLEPVSTCRSLIVAHWLVFGTHTLTLA